MLMGFTFSNQGKNKLYIAFLGLIKYINEKATIQKTIFNHGTAGNLTIQDLSKVSYNI